MIDILALAISHGLLGLAVWRLMWREDLYYDDGAAPRRLDGHARDMRGPGEAEVPGDD